MQAVRIHQQDPATPYSVTNQAPPSSLILDKDVPLPQPTRPDDVLVRIHAATVTRDELTWPEIYGPEYPILGHDFAGEVVSVPKTDSPTASKFQPKDHVYGLSGMMNGNTWAEYAVFRMSELASKPKRLGWTEAATVPLSALTAWQALFVQAGLTPLDIDALAGRGGSEASERSKTKILITGASGAVGAYLVQLAALAGLNVVAVSTSSARNGDFLRSLGASEACEYAELQTRAGEFDIIIDSVGGTSLESCWLAVKNDGILVSVDSGSYDFVKQHQGRPFTSGKTNVNAIFFIVKTSGSQLEQISKLFDMNLLKAFVANEYPLSKAREAYEAASERTARRGKVTLKM